VAVLVVVPAGTAGAATSPEVDRALAADVVAAVNDARRGGGLGKLRVSPALSRAARAHALSMGKLGYFSHSSANGSSPTRRITDYYHVSGASSWAVGEVMVWGNGRLGAARALEIWLASSPHRSEILSRRYREVGVGAVRAANAPGVYGGRSVTILVVDFGRRTRR
jgi:uncharacterized protein YkwD